MQLFNLTPIHITALLHFFEPRQLRISLHHGIDGLAHALLIDLFDIDLDFFSGSNGDFTLRLQLALKQGFISVAFAL